MEETFDALRIAWAGAVVVLAVWSLYDFAVCLAALSRPQKPPRTSRRRRFAILIPAHDEAAVIARTVESLRRQRYPQSFYEIFVVADACSDETASEARCAGASVLERSPTRGAAGKSPALRALFEHIETSGRRFDAVCVFDADNLASPNYLMAMNRHLEQGEKCIQAYLDVKNPEDSWVTGAIAVAYWSTNRLWQAARHRLGLSCALGGTGFCLDWELARELAWRTACLTDDLDLQMALVLRGERVHWAHEARTWDEKPLALAASWRQRVRWMRGHWDVARRYFFPLIARSVRRLDPVALDGALYLMQPLRTVIGALALAAIAVAMGLGWAPRSFFWAFGLVAAAYLSYLAHFCFFGLPMLGLLLEGVPLRQWRFYPAAIVYGLTWIPIAAWGMLTSRRTAWVPTVHTRVLSIEEKLAESGAGAGLWARRRPSAEPARTRAAS